MGRKNQGNSIIKDINTLPSKEDEPSITKSLLDNLISYQQPFTRIGSHGLICLNDLQRSDLFSDFNADLYANTLYKQFGKGYNAHEQLPNKDDILPHIYGLAVEAYFSMRRLGEDQSILFTGLNGSGKTENYRRIMEQLCLVSSSNTKLSKLTDTIPHLHAVLDSFGHCYTTTSPNASKIGLFQELQFNARGRMVGVKTIVFGLANSWLCSPVKGNRNFNVFYQLINGIKDKEQLYGLDLEIEEDGLDYLPTIRGGPSKHDDMANFGHLSGSLKALGIKSKAQTKIFQVLVSILHLGNVGFVQDEDQDTAQPINLESLGHIAHLLGVGMKDLINCLTYQTQIVGKERCTVLLDVANSIKQRDRLSNLLYNLLFTWIIEAINCKLCQDDPANFIALLDPIGFQYNFDHPLDKLQINFAYERLYHYNALRMVDPHWNLSEDMYKDGIQVPDHYLTLPKFLSLDSLLAGEDGESGIVGILQKACHKKAEKRSEMKLLNVMTKQLSQYPNFQPDASDNRFMIHHFNSTINYEIDGLVDSNLDVIPADFVRLFRDSKEAFIVELFSNEAVITHPHPDHQSTIVSAHANHAPLRKPSRRHKKKPSSASDNKDPVNGEPLPKVNTLLGQMNSVLNDLKATMDSTRMWSVFNLFTKDLSQTINPSNSYEVVHHQVTGLALAKLTTNIMDLSYQFDLDDFLIRYSNFNVYPSEGDEINWINALAKKNNFVMGQHYVLGQSKIFICTSKWQDLENQLRVIANNENMNMDLDEDTLPLAHALAHHNDDNDSSYSAPNDTVKTGRMNQNQGYGQFGNDDMDQSFYIPGQDERLDHEKKFTSSEFNREIKHDEKVKGLETGFPNKAGKENIEVVPVTVARKAWVRITWMLTWWIPTFLIRKSGMDRDDVIMAWREKVAICLLVLWSWIIILFVNIGLGLILCPPEKVWKPDEIKTLQGPDDLGVYMYGVVYDITDFAGQRHGKSINAAGVDPDTMIEFGGKDVTSSFPIPLTVSCQGLVTDNNFKLWTNISDDSATSSMFVHDSGPLTQYPQTAMKDPNWFFSTALPKLKRLKKGLVVHDFKMLSDYRKAGYKQWGVIDDKVYDLTTYVQTLNQPQYQVAVPGAPTANFLPNTVFQIFDTGSPAKDADLTALWKTKTGLTDSEKKLVMNCLDKQFYIGKLDPRDSLRCQLTNILLLASSSIILLVTLVKFLAALQLGSKRTPMDYDKFVICQVPCYTEGEDSLRRTFESLAQLTYDDSHKLIFVIADGMIIGSGNDKPTPRLVLDALGVDPNLDPEPFAFRSIGEGSKQLNFGKVYSGLYACEGRDVPYIVVVKVGKPSESSRPGNRGKRDSQILLMNFLNRVHFDSPMTPLDLEIYHQLKNVIGVDPSLYEYILMVDADTEVMPDSLTRLIAVMSNDSRVVGLCGETMLSNENQSITTMMQVYEYYISHNLAKAFESLFGAVTCLPGCFCMYRIKTVRNTPLIINNNVIKDYSENIVDTLHKKNLLHLGEDRYLTTLMLKHFPTYKMKFTPDAQCKTVAPDQFRVLLSQRRRWINSTIHNLFELVFLDEMCGFCCFSMRFVVFLDLIGTLILPATVIYLIYIIIACSTGFQYITWYSILIMCSAYILQALIFIIKTQWQHIGWMVFYMLGMLLFNFYIPIYSFWHFDDFSWGNTRVVMGDGVKQVITEDEETFDPDSIPMIKWSDHQQLQWEQGTNYELNQMHLPTAAMNYSQSQQQLQFNSSRTSSPFPTLGHNPYDLNQNSTNPFPIDPLRVQSQATLNYPYSPPPQTDQFYQGQSFMMVPPQHRSSAGSQAHLLASNTNLRNTGYSNNRDQMYSPQNPQQFQANPMSTSPSYSRDRDSNPSQMYNRHRG